MIYNQMVLVEDTDTAKICHSGWHGLIELLIKEGYSIIYYRNIGYSPPSNIHSWLGTEPQYLSSAQFNANNSDFIVNSLELNYAEIISKAKFLSQELLKTYNQAEPLTLYSIEYKKIFIGRYVASHLLRFYPELIQNFRPSPELVSACLEQLCTHVVFVEALIAVTNISYAFFSETVYFAGAIVEQLVLAGTKMPYPFHPTQVTLDQKHCRPLHNGKSLVYQAIQKVFLSVWADKDSTVYKRALDIGHLELVNRLSNLQHINPGATKAALDHATTLFMRTGDSSFFLRDTAQLLSCDKPSIILYLHCFADGPHYEGFSGFYSSYEFFKYIAEVIAQANLNRYYKVVVKPHPNLLSGMSSPFTVDTQKMQFDIDLSIKLIEELRQILPDLCILNPSIPNGKLIGLIRSVHITSHGSVGLEARYKGTPLVCTNTAPYEGIGLGELCISAYEPNDLKNFLHKIHKNNSFLCRENSISDKCAVYTGLTSFADSLQYLKVASRLIYISVDELCQKLLVDPLFIEKNLDPESMRIMKRLAVKVMNFYSFLQ